MIRAMLMCLALATGLSGAMSARAQGIPATPKLDPFVQHQNRYDLSPRDARRAYRDLRKLEALRLLNDRDYRRRRQHERRAAGEPRARDYPRCRTGLFGRIINKPCWAH